MAALGGFDEEPVDLGEVEETEEPESTLIYGSAAEFFAEFLAPTYVRRINSKSRVWVAEWWTSSEAVARIDALWRSWEFLRLDPATGMSVWWRDHADMHMSVLLDPNGPFEGSEFTNQIGEPLPTPEPPDGMFPDERV